MPRNPAQKEGGQRREEKEGLCPLPLLKDWYASYPRQKRGGGRGQRREEMRAGAGRRDRGRDVLTEGVL